MIAILYLVMFSILNQSAHIAASIQSYITLLSPGLTIQVDQSSLLDQFDVDLSTIYANGSRINYDAVTLAATNHAPYFLGNNPYSGYFSDIDTTAAQFSAQRFLNVWAYLPGVPFQAGTSPPAAASTIARTGVDASGNGLEFGMSPNYKGINTVTGGLSATTCGLTAIFATFYASHGTFNPADIKAAFRQTAANWATGWDGTNYGYGAVNLDAALLLTNPSQLFLQAPHVETTLGGNGTVTVTVIPFLQSRRALDRVFLVPSTVVFPLNNELTNSDILAADGIEIFSNNGQGIMSSVFPISSYKGFDIVVHTCDNQGKFSRVESYARRKFA